MLSAAGAAVATYAWASSARTRRHMGGGFEGEGTDYTVLITEMPLVALAGAALPALACAVVAVLAGRRRAHPRRSDLDR
ncbi:hypothetical protein [Streptomyces shaanxiensis]|uniref:Uncharacterized protein n=1 Tax=Streptomyces shaanxiensis TaxID=653357 RepID=A0ABP7VB54_9ACTN